jgi:hypothetical protein
LLAATAQVGDAVGDGVDAFGFHDCSCAMAKAGDYTRAPWLRRVTAACGIRVGSGVIALFFRFETNAMSELMFYERVVALNDKTHAKLKVRPTTSFAYAAKTNSVPGSGQRVVRMRARIPDRLSPAAKAGPCRRCCSACAKRKTCSSARRQVGCALRACLRPALSLRARQGAAGRDAGLHRRSFVPASDSKEGAALFADGKPTPQLDHAMKFLAEFHQGVTATEALARRLQELGLMRQADSVAQLTDGSQFRLNGLSVVDEVKLRALDRDAVQELFANGSLAVVYAHLMSLGNLGVLVDR